LFTSIFGNEIISSTGVQAATLYVAAEISAALVITSAMTVLVVGIGWVLSDVFIITDDETPRAITLIGDLFPVDASRLKWGRLSRGARRVRHRTRVGM
jgi:hypothetical protein